MFKDSFNCSIAGLADGDYRLEGRSQLICCSVDGEGNTKKMWLRLNERTVCEFSYYLPVRGYDSSRLGSLMEGNVHQDAVRDLLQKKQALLMELKNYESNTRPSGADAGQTNMNAGMIPVSKCSTIPLPFLQHNKRFLFLYYRQKQVCRLQFPSTWEIN